MKMHKLVFALIFTLFSSERILAQNASLHRQDTQVINEQEKIRQLEELRRLKEQKEKEAEEFFNKLQLEKQQKDAKKLSQEYVDQLIETSPEQVKKIISHYHLSKKQNNPARKEALITAALLLIGPAGVGKSDLAKAIAQKMDVPFVFIKSGTLGNEYVNSAASNLDRTIKEINQQYPGFKVIIVDELQAFTENGTTTKNQIDPGFALGQMIDEFTKNPNMMFIATANKSTKFPASIKSRFEENVVEVNLPDNKLKEKILTYHLKDELNQQTIDPKLIKFIANNATDFSCRHMRYLSHKILAFIAENESKQITEKDIKPLIQEIKDNIAKNDQSWDEAIEEFCDNHKYTISTAGMITNAIFQIMTVSK